MVRPPAALPRAFWPPRRDSRPLPPRRRARRWCRANLTQLGAQTYSYSAENRLTWISGTPGNGRLTYDPVGRLDRNGASGYNYQYSGDELVSEWNDGDVHLHRYVHGPGEDEPLVWYEGTGTGTRRGYHADERGSVVGISSGSGAIFQRNSYDEEGRPGPYNAGVFQYTGQARIDWTGLYHYKARAYDPRLGRFLQADPIGYEGGMNMYAYGGCDPINRADPSGTTFESLESRFALVKLANRRCGISCEDPRDLQDPIRDRTLDEPTWQNCAKAVGKAALDAAVDPFGLAAGVASAVVIAARNGPTPGGTVGTGRKTLRLPPRGPVSRTILARRAAAKAIPGGLLASGIYGAGIGLYTAFTDPRCG